MDFGNQKLCVVYSQPCYCNVKIFIGNILLNENPVKKVGVSQIRTIWSKRWQQVDAELWVWEAGTTHFTPWWSKKQTVNKKEGQDPWSSPNGSTATQSNTARNWGIGVRNFHLHRGTFNIQAITEHHNIQFNLWKLSLRESAKNWWETG